MLQISGLSNEDFKKLKNISNNKGVSINYLIKPILREIESEFKKGIYL